MFVLGVLSKVDFFIILLQYSFMGIEKPLEKTVFEPLDIKLIAEKYNPKLARVVPGWYYRRLERLLHLKEMNSFLTTHYNVSSQKFLDGTVEHLQLKTRFTGLENLEKLKGESPILVANHPMGGPESLALFQKVLPLFPDMKILMQSFLSLLEPMQKVSVYNHNLLRSTLKCVQNGDPLLMFPAGICSHRTKNKTVADPQWKATFVKLAKRYNKVIVPIYISGELSNRIHRWYRFRHLFHIGFSLETLYLVDEMYKLRGSEIVFNIGEPIYPDDIPEDVDYDIWAGRIRQYVYNLRDNPNLKFDSNKKDSYPLPVFSKKTYKDI